MKNILLLSLLFFVSHTAPCQNLKLNLQQGETYYQTSHADIAINQDFGGQKMEITMTVSGTMAFTVTEKNDDQYLLDTKYTRIAMKTGSPFGAIEFSSDKGLCDLQKIRGIVVKCFS